MKISNSKKELARIISEHGGWRNGEFAAQDGDGGVGGYGEKPVWSLLGKYWRNEAFGEWFVANKIKNYHQTVLSSEEYFHLHPAQDADGWIEWGGAPRSPVSKGTQVDVKMQNGTQHFGQLIGDECWSDCWGGANIIAYRLHKPEQAKPEFCESVARSIKEHEIHSKNIYITKVDDINVVELRSTLDQLLQDWRNADDFAKRKQAEADEASAMRDERWNAVQARAGEIGVTVGRCDSATKADQKLVITDWRDLKSGDVVMVVCSSNPAWKSIDGDELVVRIDGGACEDVYFGPWCMSDNTDWVFIRRP